MISGRKVRNVSGHKTGLPIMVKEITLTKCKISLVDDADYEKISIWKWHYSNGYAMRRETIAQGQSKIVLMHRVILGLDSDRIDHQNRNTLDNRRINLRPATAKENAYNACNHSDSKSGYKGVHWRKDNKKWKARIHYDGRQIHLGTFIDPKEAAKAYNAAAIKFYGQFAYLNEVS